MSELANNPVFWTLVITTSASVLTLTFVSGTWVGKVNSFIRTVTKFMERIDSNIKGLRSDVNDLQVENKALSAGMDQIRTDVNQIRTDVDEVRTDLNEVRTDLNEVRTDVSGIKNKLVVMEEDIDALFTRAQTSPTSGGSPLKLTEIGDEVSQLLAADEWAKSIAPSLVASVRGMRSFEIQEFCSNFLRSNFSPTSDQGLKVRACAYEFALTRNEVLNVMMVELRDELFRLLGDEHFDPKFDLTLAVT